MDDLRFPKIWGVKGLNEAEQRDVRGGVLPGERAQCIRSAINQYASSRRNNNGSRSQLLNTLRNNIASCMSGSSD